ncbi:hypothetical protein F4553_003327 [Allocatelliglobosispora scoriae]|uniref:Uncharacterized protein n=1 Tax=Allocatelliglobosispora scoriae TaxID=643052 RepID=A0A841BRC3_9ACTN|nr:hypothetical protein [Allocatelliglobosispora scoriae]MBB5869948.1 hypothetical protein [Allocatelliglobosispora scoriae]
MSEIRSSQARAARRAAGNAGAVRQQPLYARVLKLKHIRPSGVMCFFFFEGSVALAVLLALAELVDWIAVGVLPLAIAVMVKINDVIAGAGAPSTSTPSVPKVRAPRNRSATGRAVVVTSRVVPDYDNAADDFDGGAGEHDNGAAAYDDRGVTDYREDEADPDSFEYEESSRPTRQRNEPLEALDPAQRARQSAMYRYE